VKVVYDALAASAALALAFVTRLTLLHLEKSEVVISPFIGETYLKFFTDNVLVFIAITIATLFCLGFYRLEQSVYFWKPLKVLAGVSLAPMIWSLLLYYTLSSTEVLFPRGVTLLTWGYLLLFAGAPRILKYYILQQMVVDVHAHRRKKVQDVLVIGGAGYIGSQLVRDLLKKGLNVRILDSFIFGQESITELRSNRSLDIIEGDFRNVETVVRAIKGMDAVVHLGGIVGDYACSLDDDYTIETNLSATIMLAEICKVFKVERFLFASSCSVYGANSKEILSENSSLNPVSLYAQTKIASEEVLLGLTGEGFAPTILRFATLFGLSPRPRFDLFVNLVTAKAVKEGSFQVFGGSQWRPFVHVRDVSKTIIAVLEAPLSKVRGEILNVGSDENCFTIETAGRKVAQCIPGTKIEINDQIDDARDYRVTFSKLERLLGIKLNISIEDGVSEMRDALLSGAISDYSDPTFSNLKQTQKIISVANGPAVSENDITTRPRQTVRSLLKKVDFKHHGTKTGS
jgi:nucleoside-diphosphate-sugar epimerase